MMKNQLMTFSSEELNFSMSGILYEGKPAFDAVELAKSLGYTNPAKALKDHCKALIKLDYNESLELGFGEKPRGTQLAGQADLFRLILRSQLPSAERVQDWVCEDVLPSIMTTGTYSKEASGVQSTQQEISMNHDILSLARVVAEATASATMKAVMEVSGANLVAASPVSSSLPQRRISSTEFVNTDAEFVPVHKVSWETSLSDPSCRRLVQFANLPPDSCREFVGCAYTVNRSFTHFRCCWKNPFAQAVNASAGNILNLVASFCVRIRKRSSWRWRHDHPVETHSRSSGMRCKK